MKEGGAKLVSRFARTNLEGSVFKWQEKNCRTAIFEIPADADCSQASLYEGNQDKGERTPTLGS